MEDYLKCVEELKDKIDGTISIMNRSLSTYARIKTELPKCQKVMYHKSVEFLVGEYKTSFMQQFHIENEVSTLIYPKIPIRDLFSDYKVGFKLNDDITGKHTITVERQGAEYFLKSPYELSLKC